MKKLIEKLKYLKAYCCVLWKRIDEPFDCLRYVKHLESEYNLKALGHRLNVPIESDSLCTLIRKSYIENGHKKFEFPYCNYFSMDIIILKLALMKHGFKVKRKKVDFLTTTLIVNVTPTLERIFRKLETERWL